MTRYDLVIYGASGFTGAYIVQHLVTSDQFKGITFAVAGRSQTKIRETLDIVSNRTGINARATPIIIADSKNEGSLAEMAKQAKVIINAVGPYRLYGEAVVKAAVENGASHVDISGEPAFLEKMQEKYSAAAREKGVYVVGACGWDSIPCDLGVHYIKKNFDGDLNHVETFVQLVTGPAGYSFNAGTYQTAILGISQAATDGIAKTRKAIMPEKIVKGDVKPPKRGNLWEIQEKQLSGWALPFMGSDRSIVNRSQYYEAVHKGQRPVHIETYMRLSSRFWAILFAVWATLFSILVQYSFTRKILQAYPDICSFYIFKNSGPTEEQIEQASFIYWFFGSGYGDKKPLAEQHQGKPDKKIVATCKGPDAGYIATSGCVLSAALAIVKDKDTLPKEGGVYTTAAAFGDTNIYDYLASFGVTFQIEK